MQNQAVQAYQTAAKRTVNPRELEASLLSQSANHLQRIQNNWDEQRIELTGALLYNRKLWTVFLDTVAKEDNPLPQAIRQNIANLALFVMKQTMSTQVNPEPAKLNALININRELAAGLRATANPS